MRCQIRKAVVTLLVMSAWMGTALGQWKEYTDAKGVRWQYEEIAAGQSCRIKLAAVDEISGAVDIPTSVPDNGVTLSVVEIAEEAFYQCTGLTGVTIPNSVTSIKGSAFASTGLTTITIPGGVTTIGTFVFDQCDKLKRIEVAAASTTFTSVDGVLFSADRSTLVYCPNGRSGTYAVPDGVTTIGATAFAHCVLLEDVSLPAGVTRIGASAFQDCNHLKAFTLPQGVEEIGDYAFGMCQKLTEILIPQSVTELGVRAFAGCMGLSKVFLEFNKDCWVKNGAFANIASSPRLYVRDGEERALKGNGNSWWTQFTVIETAIASITVHSNGAKVPEATVKMVGKEVLTDSEGNVSFKWLEKQAHSYTVTKAGYKNGSGSVDLTAGNQAVAVELEKDLASATFTVQAGGVAVEGAEVSVDGKTGQTNAAGQATIAGLEKQAHSYTVTKAGYKNASGSVDLTAGDQTVAVELERDLANATFTVQAGGVAVEGAEVSVDGKTGQTNTAGQVTIAGLEKQVHSYTVTKAGYKNASGSVDLTAGDRTVAVELERDLANATFTVQAGGVAVEGAEVSVGGKTGQTNAAGQVTIAGLEKQAHSYTVTKAGYKNASGSVDLTAGDQTVMVELEKNLASATFTVRIGGVVVEGALVAVGGGSALTNAAGQVTFSGLERHAYSYTVTFGGYKSASGNVDLTAGDQSVTVELERDLARAAFTVLAGGKALAGAVVTVGGTSIPTNTDGEAVFEGLERQEYDYAVTKGGYKGKSGKVNLTAADQAVAVELERDLARAAFTVLAGGKALAGAIVTVGGTSIPTNTDGEAVFEGLEKQEYDYTVTKAGYKGKSGKVDLTAGDQAVSETLERDLASVTFTVLAGGKALAEAIVTVGSATMPTNAEGKAVFESLEKQEYVYTVAKAGYKGKSGKVDLTAGDQAVTVELEKSLAHASFAVLASGKPLAGASIAMGGVTVQTNAEGKAILEGFEKSEYDYTVTKVGYKNVSGKVNLAAGDQTVSVVLEKLEAPTPVESVVLRQVTVRPNPVTTELYIDNATDVERLWVASLSGVELLRRENPRGEQTLHVSLEGFAEGAYVLVVESRGEHRALRFVVRH